MNSEEENEILLEESEPDYELLGITWGKYYQKSFIFHVKQNNHYFEFIRNHINKKKLFQYRKGI